MTFIFAVYVIGSVLFAFWAGGKLARALGV